MDVAMSTIITCPSITADKLHDDILGGIFSFLLPDVSSLHSASLVCRTWALSTRRHVFESVTIRPSQVTTLIEILTSHPWPTLVPNVRRLEVHGSPDGACRGGQFLSMIASHLTHVTLQDTAIQSFDLVVSAIHSMSQLQSIALLSVSFPSPASDKRQYTGLLLPPFVRRFRIRNTPVSPFLNWLSAHPDIPPLTHLDLGHVDNDELYMVDSLLCRIASSLVYIIVAFGSDGMGHACHADKTVLDLHTVTLGGKYTLSSTVGTTSFKNIRFQQVFGIPPCSTLSLLNRLCVIHIEGFVGLFDALSAAATAAEFIAARVLASVPGAHVQRIILGLEVSSAAQLCLYNINWPFFDDILTSNCYRSLKTVEFRHGAQGNLENIADYISSKLPLAASRNLLYFCKASPNLADIHTI